MPPSRRRCDAVLGGERHGLTLIVAVGDREEKESIRALMGDSREMR